MKKLMDIKKITDNGWVDLYSAEYHCDSGDKLEYYYVSRRSIDNISIKNSQKTDAVRVLPYLVEDGKKYVVLIKEFRHAINDYIYSTPAGLVDGDEDLVDAAKREIAEEIGATVLSIKEVLKPSYVSVGLTDEKIVCYEAEVELNKTQNLDKNEEITFFKLPVDDLLEFVDSHNFCLQSAMMLKSFYYQNKLLELKNGK